MDKKELIERLDLLSKSNGSSVVFTPRQCAVFKEAIRHLEDEPFDVLKHVTENGGKAYTDGMPEFFIETRVVRHQEEVVLVEIKRPERITQVMSAHDVASWEWQPYEPKPELVYGKWYVCNVSRKPHGYNEMKMPLHYIGGHWRDGFGVKQDDVFTIEPILKDGKPVEVEID